MHKLILSALAAMSLSAAADANDPYNTYLWNRQNALAQNGVTDNRGWYEWWYFKVVNPETRQAFFFTYGIVNPWDEGKTMAGTKAVVQAGDFQKKLFLSSEFPVSNFEALRDQTSVRVGNNTATDTHLSGQINDGGHEIAWDLSVEKKWRFNAMGWATGTQDLSGIYWYPAQADAEMTGWIRMDGQTINLANAPGYQDRNWGRTFPKWWTWLTSNNFKGSPETVLAAGGGEPKVFNSVYLMSGLCIGLKHNGKQYIFRTTDMDRVQFDIRWGTWNVVAQNKRGQKIEISAFAPPSEFLLLPFQLPTGPVFYDYEALLGKMTVKVYERPDMFSNWRQVALLETDEAGIEWGTPEPLKFSTLFTATTVLQ